MARLWRKSVAAKVAIAALEVIKDENLIQNQES